MSAEFGPPALNPNKGYGAWRAEVEVWRHDTMCPPQRQALALRAKLSGQDRGRPIYIHGSQYFW